MVTLNQIGRKFQRDGFAGVARAVVRRVAPGLAPTVDENLIICRLIGSRPGTMIDVGAAHGTSLLPFAALGWTVYGFEPDGDNRAILLGKINSLPSVHIDDRAITEVDDQELTFYASPESIGVSSLTAFTDQHRATGSVRTARLDTFLHSAGINSVDYLKIDAEGHDFFVLKSFPFDRLRPSAVLCEFEDRKTIPLGYRMTDMADLLVGFGYSVIVSEWHPIRRYGMDHKWRRFAEYPTSLLDENSWGNLIAFRDKWSLNDVVAARRTTFRGYHQNPE